MPRSLGSGRNYKHLVDTLSKPFDADTCILWPYGTAKDGYGVVSYGYMSHRAHRLAFKLWYGRWPEHCALHRCDTPRCFNPLHLYEGTTQDNTADMMAKGRKACGTRVAGAVLTDDQVQSIRQEYSYRKVGCNQLGIKYGVAPCTVHAIITRRIWKHL